MKNLIAFLAVIILSVSAFAQNPLPTWTGGGIHVSGSAPTNGTSEIQTIAISSTSTAATISGTFNGRSGVITLVGTGNNTFIATEFLVGLGAIPSISGTSNLTVTVSGTTATITFKGNLAKLDVPQIAAGVTSGGITLVAATGTPGVTADDRLSLEGQVVDDTADGRLYINQGTPPNPIWNLVQSQGP